MGRTKIMRKKSS